MNEKRIYHQIRNFERAINAYTGREPLARFLTAYYKENRQMGSSDRRTTSRLCYNWFRIGRFAAELPLQERIVLAEYLCESESPIVELFRPDLIESISANLTTKIATVGAHPEQFFPTYGTLSTGVDVSRFLKSQLQQPDLFIRVKRGKADRIAAELARRSIPFEKIGTHTFALPNGTPLQDLSRFRPDFEVQDLSSQHTLDFIEAQPGEYWWDACAGSGGKALMFVDRYPDTKLLVSDVRLSILRNLNERFEKANVRASYAQKIIDLREDLSSVLGQQQFDGIILDAPCSGSGTWGRTPEMKVQFDEGRLAAFVALQKEITSNVIPYLKSGKVLTYITCSVYKEENEDVVSYIANKYGLAIDRMQLLEGYQQRADSMFVACLRKA